MKPLAEFSLTITTGKHHRGRKKLRVVIWKHLKDLRTAAHASSLQSVRYWKRAAGAYVGAQRFRPEGNRMVCRQFGEIHLWEKLIGAGYFAHELQHFMLHYAEETETLPLDPEANERMAWLAGELTNQFWTKFYERFEVQPG